MEGSRCSCSSPCARGYQYGSRVQLPTQRRTPTMEDPVEDPVEYILTGLFHTHTWTHDRTHGTISMTGCQHGAGGFGPLGPPMTGGALLRSTAPKGRRPHPTLAARRWRARVRLRRTSPSPTPVNAALLCPRRPSERMTRRALSLPGLRRLATAWGSQRRRSGSSALAKGEVRQRRK